MAKKLAPVKCCYCELSIDRNTEPYGRPLKALGSTELNPRRYAHQHCGEQYNWMPVTEFNRLKTAKKIKEEAEKNGRTVTEQKAKTKTTHLPAYLKAAEDRFYEAINVLL